MRLEGYIKYKNQDYAFVYENDFLTMINCVDKQVFSFWNEAEEIDYFEGRTVSGYQVSFYIDNSVRNFCNTYRCFPKIVFVSKKNTIDVLDAQFKAIRFSGGVINRFYSNSQILDTKVIDIYKDRKIEFKDIDSTKKEEDIVLNNGRAAFELSVTYPGWKYDGNIKFDEINSILRLKYYRNKKYKEIAKDILLINDLFFFCMNRRQQNYGSIFLETQNPENGKLDALIELYIPTGEENKYDPKYMIRYVDISGSINRLLKLLSNLKYSTYMIPKNDKEYRSISATTYSSAFSAFQSIYNYTHKKNGIVHDNKDFEELKIEICEAIKLIEDKYKGIDSKRRKFVKQFSDIIKDSQLKLEDMIISALKEFPYMIDTLFDNNYRKIMSNSRDAVRDAVNDRDLITHSDVFAPTDTDLAVYLIIERLTYAMILKKIGIKKSDIENIIRHLSTVKII